MHHFQFILYCWLGGNSRTGAVSVTLRPASVKCTSVAVESDIIIRQRPVDVDFFGATIDATYNHTSNDDGYFRRWGFDALYVGYSKKKPPKKKKEKRKKENPIKCTKFRQPHLLLENGMSFS